MSTSLAKFNLDRIETLMIGVLSDKFDFLAARTKGYGMREALLEINRTIVMGKQARCPSAQAMRIFTDHEISELNFQLHPPLRTNDRGRMWQIVKGAMTAHNIPPGLLFKPRNK